MTVAAQFRPTGMPVIDQILAGSAPTTTRAAAARGALPIGRELMLTVLVHLTGDPESLVRAAAAQSIAAFPASDLTGILGDPETSPAVLDHFAVYPSLGREPLAALIANPSLEPDAVVAIASGGSSDAIDLLLINQTCLVRTPQAVEAMMANGTLSNDQRRKLLDFREHLGGSAATPDLAEPAEVLPSELLGPVSEEELRALLGKMSDLAFIDLEVGDFLNAEGLIELPEDFDQLGESFETVYKQILRMNPPQRLRAAMRGGREARQILIRDPNRIVCSAVLRNPRISDDEVCGFANQKSLSDEVLRQIGTSRGWMGSYAIVVNLVRNPKTPLAIAMNHLPRLTTRDLTQITKDRNISEGIRRLAKKNVDSRGKTSSRH